MPPGSNRHHRALVLTGVTLVSLAATVPLALSGARQAAAGALVVEEGLREIAYGAWEGRKESEIRATDPDAYNAWSLDPALVSPPGGESAFAIAARALPVLVRARRDHPTGNVLFVSHKATIRVIVCALLGIPLGRFRDRVSCPTASVTTFEFGERGAMLVDLGDTHHLAGIP